MWCCPTLSECLRRSLEVSSKAGRQTGSPVAASLLRANLTGERHAQVLFTNHPPARPTLQLLNRCRVTAKPLLKSLPTSKFSFHDLDPQIRLSQPAAAPITQRYHERDL